MVLGYIPATGQMILISQVYLFVINIAINIISASYNITRFCVALRAPSHYTIIIGLSNEHETINLRPRVVNNDVVIKTVTSLVLSFVTA